MGSCNSFVCFVLAAIVYSANAGKKSVDACKSSVASFSVKEEETEEHEEYG